MGTVHPTPPRSPGVVRLRPRVFAVLGMLIAAGVAAHFVWQHYAPVISRHPQYQLAAEDIHITAPPAWIRSDVKGEVLRDAGLVGRLSVLDDWPTLSQRIRDAFELHPWVKSVDRIARRLPGALEVELSYRRPVAAVESADASGITFLPVDEQAIRLPEADLSDAERRYLPRISGVSGRPLVGDAWEDPRVVGAARLAAALGDVWQQLRLVEIVSPQQPLIRDDARIYTFELITSGGTRIVWGAALGQEQVVGESPFAQKRQRLLEYAARHGQLESINGPAAIDVRSELVVTPRTARRKSTKPAESTQTK